MVNETLTNIAFAGYLVTFPAYLVHAIGVRRRAYGIFVSILYQVSSAALLAGVIARWIEAGHPPVANLYESLLVFALGASIVYIIVEYAYRTRALGFFTALLGALILAYAQMQDSTVAPLMPVLKSNWLVVHVFAYLISYGAFTVSFCGAVAYLVFMTLSTEDRAAPFESISVNAVSLGFPLLTVGLVSGAVWANQTWGDYWTWDPKETWSLITWIVYAFHLHARYRRKWRGKRLAVVNILGFLVLVFTFLGLKYLPASNPSVHIYGD